MLVSYVTSQTIFAHDRSAVCANSARRISPHCPYTHVPRNPAGRPAHVYNGWRDYRGIRGLQILT